MLVTNKINIFSFLFGKPAAGQAFNFAAIDVQVATIAFRAGSDLGGRGGDLGHGIAP